MKLFLREIQTLPKVRFLKSQINSDLITSQTFLRFGGYDFPPTVRRIFEKSETQNMSDCLKSNFKLSQLTLTTPHPSTKIFCFSQFSNTILILLSNLLQLIPKLNRSFEMVFHLLFLI